MGHMGQLKSKQDRIFLNLNTWDLVFKMEREKPSYQEYYKLDLLHFSELKEHLAEFNF